MALPRCIVLPFGVPEDARGLGVGLAALIHQHAQCGDANVALAQLQERTGGDDDESGVFSPVESLITADVWQKARALSESPPSVELILTGAFEPPTDGRGTLSVHAFDARTGGFRARVEVAVDDATAGANIVAGLAEIARAIDANLGALEKINDLSWDALESVLRAERCALLNPTTQRVFDPYAALMHFGRAVADAPEAAYPALRLAGFALEAALTMGNASSTGALSKLGDAAHRALVRGIEDGPSHIELVEALSILCARRGEMVDAETHARVVVARAPSRTRSYGTVSEARRAQGDFEGAHEALSEGLARAPGDAFLCVERGIVLAEQGDYDGAFVALREVLLRVPLHIGAFANLAQLSILRDDKVTAQSLVDDALAATQAPAEVLKRAIDLALASEAEGLPRAARVSVLAERLMAAQPSDPWVHFILAQSAAQLGEKERAIARLVDVERMAKGTGLAAEAQRGLFILREPELAAEVDAVLRAAMANDGESEGDDDGDLEAVAARARHLVQATAHMPGVWMPQFAVGIAERRRKRWSAAREAFEGVLAVAPGTAPAQAELDALTEAGHGDDVPPSRPLRTAVLRIRETFAKLRTKN